MAGETLGDMYERAFGINESADSHRRGRPRVSGLTGRILVEVYAAVSREGYAAFSLETVVERSKTTRTTVYRRWRSKADLVSHALVNHGLPTVPNDATVADCLSGVWLGLLDDGTDRETALNIISALTDPDIRRHMRDHQTALGEIKTHEVTEATTRSDQTSERSDDSGEPAAVVA